MNDKIKIAIGVLVIILLLGAIVFVYLSPKTLFSDITVKNKEIRKIVPVVLVEDFKDPEKYTEISVNDVVEGKVLKSEKANAAPFGEDVILLKYIRKDVAYNNAKLELDPATFESIKKSPDKSPFRNLYFYKIKNGDNWYTILGQQVANSDGTSSFLHFLIHSGSEIYSWGSNSFAIEPFIILPDEYFNWIGPRDFFSADADYYKKGGKIDNLINSWQKTGIVPDELQKEILLMSIKM